LSTPRGSPYPQKQAAIERRLGVRDFRDRADVRAEQKIMLRSVKKSSARPILSLTSFGRTSVVKEPIMKRSLVSAAGSSLAALAIMALPALAQTTHAPSAAPARVSTVAAKPAAPAHATKTSHRAHHQLRVVDIGGYY